MQDDTVEDIEAADETPRNDQPLLFPDLGPRKVVVDFSGGHLSNDGGALLLRMVDNSLGMSRMVASCFEDRRDQRFTEHSTQHLIAQRIFGRALGYEDLNDHNDLRRDPLFAAAVGKTDPLGGDRWRGKESRPCPGRGFEPQPVGIGKPKIHSRPQNPLQQRKIGTVSSEARRQLPGQAQSRTDPGF